MTYKNFFTTYQILAFINGLTICNTTFALIHLSYNLSILIYWMKNKDFKL